MEGEGSLIHLSWPITPEQCEEKRGEIFPAKENTQKERNEGEVFYDDYFLCILLVHTDF